MAKIKVFSERPLYDGMAITFNAPCGAEAVDGLLVCYNDIPCEFTFRDANGNDLATVNHLFAEGALVKVILDTENNRAFFQNADTNAYLEKKFEEARNYTDSLHNGLSGRVDEVLTAAIYAIDSINEHKTGTNNPHKLYTISGVWVFNEEITKPFWAKNAVYAVNFTSPGNTAYSFGGFLNSDSAYTTALMYHYGDSQVRAYTFVPGTSGTALGWFSDDFRTVDFGTAPQTVTAEFYTWLTANAVYVTLGYDGEPIPVVNITQDEINTNEWTQDDISRVIGERLLPYITEMSNATTRQIGCRNPLQSGFMYGTIYKHSSGYVVIDLYGYNGDAVRRCMVNGVWNDWEWVNPTLINGTEYRTIERFYNNPVYTKMVRIRLGNTTKSIEGLPKFKYLVDVNCVLNSNSSPLVWRKSHPSLDIIVAGSVDEGNPDITWQWVSLIPSEDLSEWTAYVTLKYVKA